MLKIARLRRLEQRLRDELGEESELARHFAQALTHHDEQALGRAFERLHAAPEAVRRAVEAVILDWLFGAEGEIDLANVVPDAAGRGPH